MALVVILSIAGLAGMGLHAFRKDLTALQRATKETILWSAAQLEFEMARFTQALAEYAAHEPQMNAQTVNNRFDVLWSRVATFKTGDVGRRLSEYDEQGQAVESLFADMKAVEGRVVSLRDGGAPAALAMIPIFQAHTEPLRQLTLSVLHGEESKAAEMRENVRASAQMTALLSFAAVVLSILGMIVLAIEVRRFRRLAAANLALAEDAEAANLAKSRFLSMMSHELRTPMNGVLGLLALAKQPGLPRSQLRLIEQAEHSGRQMIGMLADILDFSAIQDDRLELQPEPFSPTDLAREVQGMSDPVARREGTPLAVATDSDCPREVVGDLPRMRQALSHLVAYVLSNAGAHDLRLDLSYSGGNLMSVLSFSYGAGGATWRPELILGAPERGADQFASDALGPAVARMLVERMGGEISLESMGNERIAVVVRIPAEAVARDETCVRLETRSAALGMIARSFLKGPDILFHEDGMSRPADVVFIEAGGEEEQIQLALARRAYPAARIIGLGRPGSFEGFDDYVELPLKPGALQYWVSTRIAS
ncbi:hypothetical protein FDP22_20100 (plasmid) [Paroceanicella profunda]|uniref:histidine kinase n=1 Tax=Paroceanicella profunda TaxID=2579971 RepID=A0A5B8G409_9RHOB|nr:histidine kinase dimerization/phospho-acceptor domain-containing protein [Paroceanicella profunda]QDL94159.1 hypothetical protein FDP22_20100 [Paroceanicella profunda]